MNKQAEALMQSDPWLEGVLTDKNLKAKNTYRRITSWGEGNEQKYSYGVGNSIFYSNGQSTVLCKDDKPHKLMLQLLLMLAARTEHTIHVLNMSDRGYTQFGMWKDQDWGNDVPFFEVYLYVKRKLKKYESEKGSSE